jgi:hypothetical protein
VRENPENEAHPVQKKNHPEEEASSPVQSSVFHPAGKSRSVFFPIHSEKRSKHKQQSRTQNAERRTQQVSQKGRGGWHYDMSRKGEQEEDVKMRM